MAYQDNITPAMLPPANFSIPKTLNHHMQQRHCNVATANGTHAATSNVLVIHKYSFPSHYITFDYVNLLDSTQAKKKSETKLFLDGCITNW